MDARVCKYIVQEIQYADEMNRYIEFLDYFRGAQRSYSSLSLGSNEVTTEWSILIVVTALGGAAMLVGKFRYRDRFGLPTLDELNSTAGVPAEIVEVGDASRPGRARVEG